MPAIILTPTNASHVQAAVTCGKAQGLHIRVRSGGHDYEGLSSVSSDDPFILLDLTNYAWVTVNATDGTAWVGAGATIGEVYYQINVGAKNQTAGFPASICTTLGISGLLSGGGIGTMMRKYGTSADNIVDAVIVDANGKLLDRKSMGDDLFWAIRGGGASSFGVILSFKINLVYVPPTVTIFQVRKNLSEGATKLVERWQEVAPKFDDNLFIRILVNPIGNKEQGNRTIQASFQSLFLGGRQELLSILDKSFPELGVEAKDCAEMSWINSTLYFAQAPELDPSFLLNRHRYSNSTFKAKSDFVKEPIPAECLEKIWKFLLEAVDDPLIMILDPLGGRMDEIAETALPFPHRKGNLYNIQHYLNWPENEDSQKHLDWMKSLYDFMAPYVSKNPRAAYLNYRDIDLGRNEKGKITYSEATEWGERYFTNNFKRLAQVKAKVDPDNYFQNEQSIPPYSTT
ncbi:Berberine bridge enzyme-like 26 [Cocos nucifera]|uniref:Berberine bridge enzyme-like 26 n=1 Tax=Cocos nucifera TaxID=13894 RepID=A0A8K0IDS0_COCNU|nr:Berberine bridge enzyme-like 26 [Cocos nucifera]